MARPELSDDDKMTAVVKVRMTQSDFEALKSRAESSGMKLPEFLRRSALSRKIKTVPIVNQQTFIALGKIGSNLNQLTRAANEGRIVETGPTVATVLALVRQVKSEVLGDDPDD